MEAAKNGDSLKWMEPESSYNQRAARIGVGVRVAASHV
jgi:hypothetical protein